MKHTQLPWAVHNDDTILGGPHNRVVADCENTPAALRPSPATDQDKANAAFIVRACNAHADLVEALGRLIWLQTSQGVRDDEMYQAMESAGTALAKAKGEA